MRRFASSGRTAIAVLAIELAVTSPIAAQAKIERVIGAATGVMVQRAGATREEPATVGMELLPGDMLRADTSAKVELKCTTRGGTTYRLPGSFRLFIDVPVNALCTVNVLDGHADVLAEEPSNTTGGTIALASKGTQYSVDVGREGRALVCRVVVFEGEVVARASERRAVQGSTIQWTGRAVSTGQANARDVERSAALYATFDVAAARSTGPQGEAASYDDLKALHYAVLSNPADTAKRVELAKRQIRYKVDDQAAYNLKRANVTNDAALRRYQIDPRTIRDNPRLRERVYRSAETTNVRPPPEQPSTAATATTSSAATRAAATATTPTPTRATTGERVAGRAAATRAGVAVTPGAAYPAAAPTPAPTTDGDLQLITDGKIDEAIRNLESRVAAGSATSRDHYALAKAYDDRDAAKVREHATRAISLQVTDGKLTDAELEAVRDLLVRAG
jgi:hypothetical protein